MAHSSSQTGRFVKSETPDWARAIRERRRELGLSQDELAFRMEVSQSLVSQIERGVQNPIDGSAEKLARLLANLRWSVERFQEVTGLSADVAIPARQPLATLEPIADQRQRLVPLYDACAGYGLESEPMGYEPVLLDSKGDVAFKVNGHSMVPTIKSGDVVIVQKDVYTLGDIVAAQTSEGLVIKKLVIDNETQRQALMSNNPDYNALFDEYAGSIHIIGRVIQIRTNL